MSPSADAPSFEGALAELERIVNNLEDGKLDLAESLTRYEAGIKLLKQCFHLLENAERRIELLTGVDAAGNPITQPFDDQATIAANEYEVPRSRRGGKSRKQDAAEPPSGEIDEPGALF
ncbi:MAG: exodeoxyribonuclease VII small subunit [Pirellulales bacterium]|nr:exodeoxyribonuclease VII small subunit [Pirellulales bacterium]